MSGRPRRGSVPSARPLARSVSPPPVPLFNQFNSIEQQARAAIIAPSSLASSSPSLAQPIGLVPQVSVVPSDSNSNPVVVHKMMNVSGILPPPFEKFKNTSDQDIENWIETFSNWCDINQWSQEVKC